MSKRILFWCYFTDFRQIIAGWEELIAIKTIDIYFYVNLKPSANIAFSGLQDGERTVVPSWKIE